jgi:aerobic carbon-monoxide dehydrogenase large subunit
LKTPSSDGIGAPVRRTEDRRFLTGKGTYTDDVKFPRQAYMALVRSPHAHAVIRHIDAADARQMPGVIAVFTGAQLQADGVGPLPCIWQITDRHGRPMSEPPRRALAVEKVRHVGDAVAMVIGETELAARDAAEAVIVDYEPLPAVVKPSEAARSGQALVHDEAQRNVCFDWHLGNEQAVDAAFASAFKVVSIELRNTRIIANPMEPRSAVADHDVAGGSSTLYTSSQNPHLIRSLICNHVLNLSEHRLRVVAPDVGGGFGVKCYLYPEEVLVLWAARTCQRPIKWTADRSESFVSDAHARDHVTQAALAVDEHGRFLALKVSTIANLGAYLSTWGPSIPTYLYAPMLAGQYTTPAIYATVQGVFTNTLPVDAYRGAGRPEANYVLERLADKAARELHIDRVELRRRNLIPLEAMPYATPVGMVYDSGDFEKCLHRALTIVDYRGLVDRKKEARARGRLRGLGISCYIEACGLSPSRSSGQLGSRIGLYESAQVRVNPDASVTLLTGAHSHGQGHETAFAQIVSDRLGVPLSSVEVVHGDTAKIAYGLGTYGSRSAAVGGSAIAVAVDRVIAKGTKIAAHLLEASAADIVFERGQFSVAGTDRTVSIQQIAKAAYVPHNYPLESLDPGLDELAFYDPKNFTFPNGTHVCELEIDPATGLIEIVRFVAVDDFGRIINPIIVEGQVHGGLAQGIGQALLEQVVYDEETGQLLTGSFMDYCMPRAADLPKFEVAYHQDTPCVHNPLGVKGCGESGTIGAASAVMNAVNDALADVGVGEIDMPASPHRVWRSLRGAALQAELAQ